MIDKDKVKWVVNNLGELGVEVEGVYYFLYKGDSLVYKLEDGDDSPMWVRPVGKREFGEVCYPAHMWEAGKSRRLDPTDPKDGLADFTSAGIVPRVNGGWIPLPLVKDVPDATAKMIAKGIRGLRATYIGLRATYIILDNKLRPAICYGYRPVLDPISTTGVEHNPLSATVRHAAHVIYDVDRGQLLKNHALMLMLTDVVPNNPKDALEWFCDRFKLDLLTMPVAEKLRRRCSDPEINMWVTYAYADKESGFYCGSRDAPKTSSERYYLAFVLSEECREEILRRLRRVTPAGDNVICHHVTLLPPTLWMEREALEFARNAWEIKCPAIHGVNYAWGKGIDAMGVVIDGETGSDVQPKYHVTLSVAPGHSAKESNDLTFGPSRFSSPIELRGSFQVLSFRGAL